ncbi:PilZ domain-containing protein [Roseimaritima sediminicola]|uniref:PilZ domain-containing protein n=1 Tax=Roseimaritima sediminicola TaxID=2662066 RepID=UPI001298537C|nr:PilZ domain-containing protein [Roseimaritima sediminicola]
MTESTQACVRTDQRFVVSGDVRVPVAVAAGKHWDQPCCRGQLNDVSASGCQLQVDRQLPPETSAVIVRIEKPDRAFAMEVAARVCWQRQSSVGQFAYGLRFRRVLPEEILQTMILRGIVSRRDNLRQPVRLPVEVHFQLVSQRPVQAVVVDVSEGGVQLHSPRPLDVGQRTLARLGGGQAAMLRVVWSVAAGDAHRAGCAFLNVASKDTLHAAV